MMRRAYIIFRAIFFDPLILVMKFRAIPIFLKNIRNFNNQNRSRNFIIKWKNIRYYTYERYLNAGSIGGHYFLQDVWAASKIFDSGNKSHVDIGSRIDGFIAHLLPFCSVEYVDIRPMKSPFNKLVFKEGSILSLPYSDDSVASLSCLHVIEHIGLGRYGDEVDSIGHIKAAKELVRILKPGGKLYIGTPVGKESLFFDAHRVFHVETVIEMFSGLSLESFDFIDDKGTEIKSQIDYSAANANRFGCGLFVFRKK